MSNKNKHIILLPLLFALILLFPSCVENRVIIDSSEKAAFLDATVEGYYRGGVGVFTYSEYKHQKSFNQKRNEFRIQTDSQDKYLDFKMEYIPKNLGVNILCELTYFDENEDISATILFECSKLSEEMAWFWYADDKIGIIVKK